MGSQERHASSDPKGNERETRGPSPLDTPSPAEWTTIARGHLTVLRLAHAVVNGNRATVRALDQAARKGLAEALPRAFAFHNVLAGPCEEEKRRAAET